MTDSEIEKRVAAIRAARAARGMNDPLNRLSLHINRAIANGAEVITNQEEAR